jgi:hypothetical protein
LEVAAIAEKGVTLFASSTRATNVAGAPEIMAQFGAEQLPKLHAL